MLVGRSRKVMDPFVFMVSTYRNCAKKTRLFLPDWRNLEGKKGEKSLKENEKLLNFPPSFSRRMPWESPWCCSVCARLMFNWLGALYQSTVWPCVALSERNMLNLQCHNSETIATFPFHDCLCFSINKSNNYNILKSAVAICRRFHWLV